MFETFPKLKRTIGSFKFWKSYFSFAVYTLSNGTTTINNGTIPVSGTIGRAVDNSGTLTINGGTITALGTSSFAVINDNTSTPIIKRPPAVINGPTVGYIN